MSRFRQEDLDEEVDSLEEDPLKEEYTLAREEELLEELSEELSKKREENLIL